MAVKFKTARFDARFGPKSLFDRIQFKMKDQHAFTLSKHCKQRIDERAVPMEVIVDAKQFDARQWKWPDPRRLDSLNERKLFKS